MTAALRSGALALPIVEGTLRSRQWGPWTALVECSSSIAPAPGAAASIVLRREDGAEDTFAGTVRRSRVLPGSETMIAAIVAGAGGLLAALPAVPHVTGVTPVSAGLVLARIAADAGELLADGVEVALDARTLPRWHRAAGTPGWQALDLLADELGMVWRFLPSGRLWMGAEAWPEVPAPTYIAEDADDGATVYAPDGAPVVAGQTVGGARIVEAVYSVAPGRLRLTARAAVAGDPPRTIDRDLYARAWPAKVIAQRADGTLDLRCDDARMGELLAVPLRLGIPGASAAVPAGARVRLTFEAASPASAFAAALDADPLATAALALVGDSCGYMVVTCAAPGSPASVTFSSTATGAPGEVQVTVRGPGHKYAKGTPG